MDYRATTIVPATALLAFSLLAAAGCASSNRSAERAQLAAARANAAADHAEASAAAAEKAAQDASAAADRVERTVREDSKAIDADIARINYLIAQHDRRMRRRRKSRKRHHATASSSAIGPTSVRGVESGTPEGKE